MFDTWQHSYTPGAKLQTVHKYLYRKMAIQKQEFYEGAALHQLIRNSCETRIIYTAPFFVLDDRLQVYLKYSTGVRTPWGFTFNRDEQVLLYQRSATLRTIIGLICGADGIAALPFEDYKKIAIQRDVAVRVACQRRHRESFEVSGPDGNVAGKIPPSDWQRVLKI